MTLEKNTRYIYKVVYGPKDIYNNYDVIKEVHYIRWDNEKLSFNEYYIDRKNFALGLINNDFKAKAGYKYNKDEFLYLVDVIAYRQNDGEIWLKTKPDETDKNNLELLEYAKYYNFAERE